MRSVKATTPKRGEPGYVSPLTGIKRGPHSPELKAKLRAARVAVIPPLEVRFWSKVARKGPTECWLWTGCIQTRGYGQFHVGLVDGKCKRVPAHRVAWELHNGRPVPEGLVIDHICKVTACVNPHHLRPVLQYDNCMDLASRNPFKENRDKKSCKYGHPFDEANTVWHKRPTDPGPSRVCATCRPWARNSIFRIGGPEKKPHRGPSPRQIGT